MDMTSLFPNEGALEGGMDASAPHVQFKAGLMTHDPATNLVTPDPRKGMLQIVTSAEDSLTHLQWRARPGAEIEHDLIVFPGESVMKRVASSPARVYVLKWLGSASRMFFWMQAPDEATDAPIIDEVNRILSQGPQQAGADGSSSARVPAPLQQPPVPPPRLRIPETPVTAPVPDAAAAAASARAALSLPATPGAAGVAAGGASAAAAAAAAAAVTGGVAAGGAAPVPPASGLTLESFSRLLDAMPSVQNPAGGQAGRAEFARARAAALSEPSIPELLRSAELTEAFRSPQVQAALPGLYEHLPPAEHSPEAVAEVVRCPQLLTQAAALSRALNAGHGGSLLRSLGLDEAEVDSVGMKALLDALKKVRRSD